MKTIDIHAHWYPQEWIRLFEKDGAKEGASLERKDGDAFKAAGLEERISFYVKVYIAFVWCGKSEHTPTGFKWKILIQ